MITVEKISEGQFESGMTYQITDQGMAFGGFGEWALFVDASQVSQGRALNRAARNVFVSPAASSTIEIDTLNGYPAFKTGSGRSVLEPELEAPQDEWSAVFVLGLHGDGTYARRNVFRTSNVTESDPDFLGLNIFVGGNSGVSSLRLTTTGGPNPDGPIRISYTKGIDTYKNKTFLAIFTFSVAEGLKLFINGQLMAARPEDKRNLTLGSKFSLFPTLIDGLCPELLLNTRDLSLIPGAIAAISNFYENKYQLSPL